MGTVSRRAAKRKRLIKMLRRLKPAMRQKLRELKRAKSALKKQDFVWHSLLLSFATMGNSRGAKGLRDPANYREVTFEVLSKLNHRVRRKKIEQVLRSCKVRMPHKKAKWLATDYRLIVRLGGLKGSRAKAMACRGEQEKIEFMKEFDGIGDKYARNIWMNVYHRDFHEAVAIDERIKGITEAMGYKFPNYKEHEQFYKEIAHQAGLRAWELDRLLYNFTDYFKTALSSRPAE